MATNLIAQMMKEFKGEPLSSVASALGEDPTNVYSALGAVVPALIGGLANKTSTVEQAGNLLGLLENNQFDTGPFTSVSSALKAPAGASALLGAGQPLLQTLFGARSSGIADWVTALSGIRRGSASSLMALALPLVLGQIGRLLKGSGWNAANLLGLLGDQRAFLADAPAGLAAALDGTAPVAPIPPPPNDVRRASAPRRSSWLWAIPLLLLIPLLLYFFARRDEPRVAVQNAPAARAQADQRPVGTSGFGAFVNRRLPDSTILRVPANGVESKLLSYIADPRQRPTTETWFSFDRLEFHEDSATLTPQSSEQLQNIARILHAYPRTKIKIGGYTDNTGDATYNQGLSERRANAAMNQIAAYGIERSRLRAEGYGEQHPVADNNTEAGRQRNRRIDIRVTDK